jgi:hypothetical protein
MVAEAGRTGLGDAVFAHRRLRSIIVGTEKLILDDAGLTELYDLGADPLESRNLALDRPAVVDSLRRRLLEVTERHGPPPPRAHDDEDLRALGYVQ